MSLVVLSNQQTFNDTITSQDIEDSARFQNHFTKAVEIPVNSEVAVISAKLNRNQNFTIPRRSQIKVYLGDELSSTTSLTDTTSIPIQVPLYVREQRNLTINEMRDRLDTQLKKYTLHPEFIDRTVVSASYGTGNVFDGFNIQVSASKNGEANSSAVSSNWFGFCDTSKDFVVSSCGTYGQVITSTSDGLGECCAVGTDSPIATSSGEMRFTLKDGASNNFAWSVGLTRPLNVVGNPRGSSTADPESVYPYYYNVDEIPLGFVGYNDIRIVKEIGETGIRVFQTGSIYDAEFYRTPSAEDNEILYWDGSALNSCFTAESGPVNSASFSSYKISVKNERVSIYGLTAGTVAGGVTAISLNDPGQEYTPGSYTNVGTTTDGIGSGATLNLEINGLGSITSATVNQAGSGYAVGNKILPDATVGEGIELDITVASVTSGGSGSYKLITGAFTTSGIPFNKKTKPLNQNEWALYPVVEINGATDDFVHITRWNGAYKPDGTKIDYYNDSWYNKVFNATNRQLGGWGYNLHPQNLDTRSMRYVFDTSNTYVYNLERGSGANVSVDKSVVYVVGQTDRYLPTNLFPTQPNFQGILGFQNPVVDETTFATLSDNDSVRLFTSTTQPITSSTKQAFIKLDNLNIESFNGATSDISKILYTLPRFDNSGNAVGSLYFESPDRYYLRLNNTAPLLLNRLDCSVVNIDNTIVQSLYGNTIVMLHFRSAK
tara:strand:- start:10869 stop:13022 length:2154 start_codon:yes stop_codon:yes gene_type:complete